LKTLAAASAQGLQNLILTYFLTCLYNRYEVNIENFLLSVQAVSKPGQYGQLILLSLSCFMTSCSYKIHGSQIQILGKNTLTITTFVVFTLKTKLLLLLHKQRKIFKIHLFEVHV
jgi:hypothetical protein